MNASCAPPQATPGPAYPWGTLSQDSGSSVPGAPKAGQASQARETYGESLPQRGGSSSDSTEAPGQQSRAQPRTRPLRPILPTIPRVASPAQLGEQQISLPSRPSSRASQQISSQGLASYPNEARRDLAVSRSPIEIMPGPRPPSPIGHEPAHVQLEMYKIQNKWLEGQLYEAGHVRSKEDLDDLYAGRNPRHYGRSVADQLVRKRKASKSPTPKASTLPQPVEYGKIVADDAQLATRSRGWGPGQWLSFHNGLYDRWSEYQQPPQEFVNPAELSVDSAKPRKGESSSGRKG
ncbi:hypothetical protein EJ03DRAFT_32294 [Teratosphaeria nubilosa]|uniref:Uncharacterized protein n=1 Tax=Teratosphaeria nubilosa TaxID=161662 RepID=A0A6G1KVN0_9PEZI|nr:hypothetical protein EJ03DRAFT_32294 [Teratosphaeria nubilosa]